MISHASAILQSLRPCATRRARLEKRLRFIAAQHAILDTPWDFVQSETALRTLHRCCFGAWCLWDVQPS
ncbi:hypothetical protein OEZ85_004803 [Tetradesmus obliquus]|uniref:Uncharacterized protein n=1 Tax=Tetradesmus obliquus TaxID=3088 RepID=A0ABY8UGJ8_TETOB|nr:hypothetical protein OEZ85_004803 [Tetradesmus obliquus]